MDKPERFGPPISDIEAIEGLREIASIRREGHDRRTKYAEIYAPLPGRKDDPAPVIPPLLPEGSIEDPVISHTDPGDFGDD